MLRDLSVLTGGKGICGTHLVGVPASAIPVGFPLSGLLNNDISSSDPVGCLYRVEVLERPASGNLFIDENGAFSLTGAPDGTYTGNLINYKNNVSEQGSYSMTIGAAAATVTGVVVSPATPTVPGTGTQQFTAVVNGTNNPSQSVTWTKSGAGTLSSTGLYTAPSAISTVQTVTITATSSLDNTKVGFTTLSIPALVVSTVTGVTVTPTTATVPGLGTQQFTAVVAGTNGPSQAVVWSNTGTGTISSSGLYTAPASTNVEQTVTVTATSVANGTKFAVAILSIPAIVPVVVTSVDISPLMPAIQGLGTQQFTATVNGTNSPSQSVVWSLVGPGSLSTSGLYTAPVGTLSLQTASVTATSVLNNTKLATTVVSVLPLITVTGVTITPAVSQTLSGKTRQLTAVVEGENNPPQTVTWAISTTGEYADGEVITNASISSTGLFTAPEHTDEELIYYVFAVSTVDATPSKRGQGTIIVPKSANIVVAPSRILRTVAGNLLQRDPSLLTKDAFYLRGRKWMINKDPDDVLHYAIDMQLDMQAASTTIKNVEAIPVGVTVGDNNYVRIQGSLLIIKVLGGVYSDEVYNSVTLRITCSNNEVLDRTIYFVLKES